MGRGSCVGVLEADPIGTQWVDVNKGVVRNPEVRCGLVAQEVNTYKEDAFFAATPPLEALRLVLSHVATGTDSRNIMILDAKKAHLHAYAEREMFVALPPERRRPSFCGRLVRSLYGTRDAPYLWEKFRHPRAGTPRETLLRWSMVTTSCSLELMQTWRGPLRAEGEHPPQESGQEIRVLNRVLRWTAWGIAYEADPRHAELLIQASGPSASLRTTPGLKPTSGAPGSWAEARLYRACAARANYLALDRVDVAFAAKELCRRMSSPVFGGLGGPPAAGPVPRGSTPLSLAFCMAAGGGTSRPCGYGLRRVPCDPTIDVRWHDIPWSAHHQTLGGHAETRDAIVRRS